LNPPAAAPARRSQGRVVCGKLCTLAEAYRFSNFSYAEGLYRIKEFHLSGSAKIGTVFTPICVKVYPEVTLPRRS
jgi:hypothetical protein